MIIILSKDPASGTVPYQAIEYYDDGSEPVGTVTEVIGGSNSRGIARQEFLVIDPRLTDNAASTFGKFGSAARNYSAGIATSADADDPVSSATNYTLGHLGQFKAAVNELASDPTLQAIAHHEAAFGLSPAQVLGQVIKTGVGAGILLDASKVAGAVGLSSGAGVISTEFGAVALTIGAIAQDYATMTGGHFSAAHVEHNVAQAVTTFTNGSIHHNA